MHLTNAKMFKQYNYPSWKMGKHGDMGITIKKDNQVTNWKKYIQANMNAGLFGTGYTVEPYKKLDGVKKAVVNKFDIDKKVKKTSDCKSCDGKGYFTDVEAVGITDPKDPYSKPHIERCDDCLFFDSDAQAVEFHNWMTSKVKKVKKNQSMEAA